MDKVGVMAAVQEGTPVPSCTVNYTHALTYLLTYLLTPWSRVLLEKLTGLQLVKKFPTFHGTRRFITALTSVRHLSLSWASPIQSIYPHPTSWRSILILSTHLCLGLPSGLLPSGFPSKTLHTPLSSPIRATCPAHLILLDFITRTILGEEYKSFSSSLCNHALRVRICCHNSDYFHINGYDRTILVILAKHCTRLPDDGSSVIRNMLEHF